MSSLTFGNSILLLMNTSPVVDFVRIQKCLTEGVPCSLFSPRTDSDRVPGRVSLSRTRNVPGSFAFRKDSLSLRFIMPKYHLKWVG